MRLITVALRHRRQEKNMSGFRAFVPALLLCGASNTQCRRETVVIGTAPSSQLYKYDPAASTASVGHLAKLCWRKKLFGHGNNLPA